MLCCGAEAAYVHDTLPGQASPAADQVDSVVGQRAAGGLVEGQVLTEAALTEGFVPAAGERLVAIRLDTGRVPGGLSPGARVDVLCDVAAQIASELMGSGPSGLETLDEPSVILAPNLAPSDTARIPKGLALAFVTADLASGDASTS